MILVFSALLEYAFVNSLTRMELERRKKKQRQLAARAAQEGHALLEAEADVDNPSPKHDMLVNQANNSTEIVSLYVNFIQKL